MMCQRFHADTKGRLGWGEGGYTIGITNGILIDRRHEFQTPLSCDVIQIIVG